MHHAAWFMPIWCPWALQWIVYRRSVALYVLSIYFVIANRIIIFLGHRTMSDPCNLCISFHGNIFQLCFLRTPIAWKGSVEYPRKGFCRVGQGMSGLPCEVSVVWKAPASLSLVDSRTKKGPRKTPRGECALKKACHRRNGTGEGVVVVSRKMNNKATASQRSFRREKEPQPSWRSDVPPQYAFPNPYSTFIFLQSFSSIVRTRMRTKSAFLR